MAKTTLSEKFAAWRRDPERFITEALINPETGRRFELFEAEQVFLKYAFTPTDDGDLPFKDILWSCIKKSGKSTFGALCMLYTIICLGGRFAEGYVIANDEAQATDRIFTAAARIVEASPLLQANITATKIEFSNGSFIQALASDYKGAAGSAPTIVLADEIWAFTSEGAARLWDECCPTPTRKPSVRMVTSYAGFTGESALLEGLVNRGLAGEMIAKDLYTQPGMIAFISYERIAPWQSEKWFEDARRSTRPSAFMRQYQNEFTAGESSFVDMDDLDLCVDPDARPVLADPRLSVWVGVDASVKRDSTAVVAATFIEGKVRLVWHRTFQPSPEDPLDFEATIEKTLLELRRRFWVREIRYDPYQLVAVAQRLTAAGLPMIEFPQSIPNLTESSSNLYEAIKGHNLTVYPDADLRLAISRCVALETSRGWRIAKEKQSHKIDVVVALAMAALGATQQGQVPSQIEWTSARPFIPPGRFTERPVDDRLHANGRDVCAAEDAASARLNRTWSSRWKGSGY